MSDKTRMAGLIEELRDYHRRFKILKFKIYDDLEALMTSKRNYDKDEIAMRIIKRLKELK